MVIERDQGHWKYDDRQRGRKRGRIRKASHTDERCVYSENTRRRALRHVGKGRRRRRVWDELSKS